jgi:transcriptional regulator of acetoin/glycerol metabolism
MSRQTTARAAVSPGAAGARTRSVVRWLYPEEQTSLVGDDPVVFGRGGECGCTLQGAELSRRHAELRREGPLLVVRDLGTTNGTFVNGSRVTEAPIGPGDVLRLGDCVGMVGLTQAEGPVPVFAELAPGLWGGEALAASIEPARLVAGSGLPVVLEGETGTGKEVVAGAIHAWSGRPKLLATNCAALPASMVEAELFGYRRGAFTGAERATLGLFRTADGGTLLLDEIADLSLETQAKLLRVIEQQEVVPLGETAPVRIDVRLVVAVQGSLAALVQERRFRPDLYARLEGVTVRLPPLRERPADAVLLFRRILADRSGGRPPPIAADFVERLCLHRWPYNVREVVQLASRLAVVAAGRQLVLGDLPERMRTAPEPEPVSGSMRRPGRRERAREKRRKALDVLLEELTLHQGNVLRAANAAGLSRQQAYRILDGADHDVDLEVLRGARRAPKGTA